MNGEMVVRDATAVVVGGVLYGYVMHSIDLPEEIAVYMAVGFGLGLVVGRWPIVAAGLSALSIGIADPSADRVLWEIICFVYLPAAVLSVAAGVLMHFAAHRLIGRWSSAR